MLLTKYVDTDHQSITLTEPDLALVNKFALKTLTADDVWLGRVKLVNDRYDRHKERLPREYLERIAVTAADRPVISGHDKRTLPLGRFYDARVLPDPEHAGQHYVSADYYVNRRTQKGQDLISDIEAGIVRHVSVTASCGPMTCDLCREPYIAKEGMQRPGCKHKKGKLYDGREATATYDPAYAPEVEMWEGSFVYWPAQHGTEAVSRGLWLPDDPEANSAGRTLYLSYWGPDDSVHRIPVHIPDAPADEGGAMQIDTLEKALSRIEELENSERETTLQKQLGELRDRLEPLEKAAAEGAEYREDLRADVLRIAGVVHKEATYKDLLEHLPDASVATLKKWQADLKAEERKLFGPVAPQGKADGPGDDEEEKPKQSWRERFRGGYF